MLQAGMNQTQLADMLNVPYGENTMRREGGFTMTQYEVMHMENLMVRDSWWDDGNYWDDDEEDP